MLGKVELKNTLNQISIAMIAVYPFIAYFSLWLDKPLVVVSYLIIVLFLMTAEKFFSQQLFTGSLLLLSIIFIVLYIQSAPVHYLLFLPPVLILLNLFILFAQSLSKDKTPLISLYAKLLGDKLEERHLRYNRNLTKLWASFFLTMIIISITLALFSSLDSWSLFTHVISYGLIASLFLVEFIYRKYHFSGEVKYSFFQFIHKIMNIHLDVLNKK